MSSDSHSPFASFPVELVRYIFELAGRADRPSASQLVLVSRPVHSWILPILYETIVIQNAHQCSYLHRTLSSSSVLARCVKNISIRVYEGDDDPYRSTVAAFSPSNSKPGSFQHSLASILLCCSSVSNLSTTLSLDRLFRAVSPSSGHVHPVQPQAHVHYTSRLTHLQCASWDSWLYFTQHIHLFARLTHLRIDPVYNSGLSDSWSSITQHPIDLLPDLTHLAFSFDSRSSPIEFIHLLTLVKCLLKRQRLQSLVVMGWYCWNENSAKLVNVLSGIKDPRVHILTSPSYLDEKAGFLEWIAATRGGKDLWDRDFNDTAMSLALSS